MPSPSSLRRPSARVRARTVPRGVALRASLALLGLALLGLVLLLWWTMRAQVAPPAGLAPSAASVAPPSGALASPGEREGELRPGAAGELVARHSGVGVGVRLHGPGRLEGRVIVRSDGSGVPGARVELLPLPPVGADLIGRVLPLAGIDEAFHVRTRPAAVAESGELGAFAFEGVRVGTWFIDVKSPYHVPESPTRARVLPSGAGGPIDVFVRLGGQVHGRVLHPSGEPVPGALVLFVPGPGNFIDVAREGALRLVEVRADEAGRFAIQGVPPGRGFELSATGRGIAMSHLLDVEVVAGRDTEVVLTAHAGGSLRGRVVALPFADGDDDGAEQEPRPVAGAHVGAVPRGLRDLRFAAALLEATHAVSDAQGLYVVQHVPRGEVDVVAWAPGLVPGTSPPVRVVDGLERAVEDIELRSGPTVRGRVVDSDGRPIAGVNLRWDTFDWRSLRGGRGLELGFAPFLTQAVEGFHFPRTAADGAFLAGPFPGDAPHRIDFYAPRYREQSHRWKPAEEGPEIEVTLLRGGAIEGVVMDLARAAPVTQFSISTRARVETSADEPGRRNPFSGGQLVEAADGRFRVDSVQSGPVTLTFDAPGYLPTRLEGIEVSEGGTVRGVIVKMTAGGTVRGVVVDERGEPVPGALVAAVAPGDGRFQGRAGRRQRGARRGAAPDLARNLPPALFGLAAGIGLLGDESARCDERGAFELLGVRPGALALAAWHPKYVAGRSAEIELDQGALLEGVEIELSCGGGVHGTVLDRHGRPLPGSYVYALAPAQLGGGARGMGSGLHQALADEGGDYRIEHMAAGSYFLVATRGDEALNPLSFLGSLDLDLVTVPGGEMVEYDLIDESAGGTRVYGRVSERGQPVEHASITALCFEGEGLLGVDVKVARVGADGEYEFPGLAPAEYRFQLEGAGPRVRMTVDVPDMAEYRLDLRLPEGGVEGRVIDESSGEPVARCEVQLRPSDAVEAAGLLGSLIQGEGMGLRERTGSDGRFEFQRVQAGAYELLVRPPSGRNAVGRKLAPGDPLALVIHEGAVERGLELLLRPALALRGRVLDADGLALSGANVSARRGDEPGLGSTGARTDENGGFELESLAPGEYTLSAQAQDHAPGRVEGVVLAADGPAPEVEIRLERGIAVAVLVLAADGSPLSGARGRLAPSAAAGAAPADLGGAFRRLLTGEGTSDSEGRLELGRHGPGQYELDVWRGLARTRLAPIELRAGSGPVELRVTMP